MDRRDGSQKTKISLGKAKCYTLQRNEVIQSRMDAMEKEMFKKDVFVRKSAIRSGGIGNVPH